MTKKKLWLGIGGLFASIALVVVLITTNGLQGTPADAKAEPKEQRVAETVPEPVVNSPIEALDPSVYCDNNPEFPCHGFESEDKSGGVSYDNKLTTTDTLPDYKFQSNSWTLDKVEANKLYVTYEDGSGELGCGKMLEILVQETDSEVLIGVIGSIPQDGTDIMCRSALRIVRGYIELQEPLGERALRHLP
jgi:hypothetical protein